MASTWTPFIAGIERDLIQRSLERTGGNKGKAARLLNLKRTTLVEKLKRSTEIGSDRTRRTCVDTNRSSAGDRPPTALPARSQARAPAFVMSSDRRGSPGGRSGLKTTAPPNPVSCTIISTSVAMLVSTPEPMFTNVAGGQLLGRQQHAHHQIVHVDEIADRAAVAPHFQLRRARAALADDGGDHVRRLVEVIAGPVGVVGDNRRDRHPVLFRVQAGERDPVAFGEPVAEMAVARQPVEERGFRPAAMAPWLDTPSSSPRSSMRATPASLAASTTARSMAEQL